MNAKKKTKKRKTLFTKKKKEEDKERGMEGLEPARIAHRIE